MKSSGAYGKVSYDKTKRFIGGASTEETL